tara:strand:- start:1815 stop:2624 length:810 start_codon:yes stop_codon:yes gene_type:complete
VIITGGSRGQGLSNAIHLSKKGYNIALVDISKNACQVYNEIDDIRHLLSILSTNGTKNNFYECDLTDPELTKEVFKKIIDDFLNIHSAVLCAGGDIIGYDKNASGGKAIVNNFEISDSDHNAIFDRNYKTTLNSLKAIIPFFRNNKHGKIVTTSSVSAGYGVDKETAYSISKAAVIHLTKSVAVEMREFGVNVNCIAPGATLTGRFLANLENRSKEDIEKLKDKGESILNKPALPEYISDLVEFLISSKSKYITGQVIRIDGGQFTSPI